MDENTKRLLIQYAQLLEEASQVVKKNLLSQLIEGDDKISDNESTPIHSDVPLVPGSGYCQDTESE